MIRLNRVHWMLDFFRRGAVITTHAGWPRRWLVKHGLIEQVTPYTWQLTAKGEESLKTAVAEYRRHHRHAWMK